MKNFTRLIGLCFFIFALSDSCIPAEYWPKVITADIINITKNSAVCGGNVTTDQGKTILERGVCWSESPYPNITENRTSDGASIGVFSSNLTGLQPGTIYHVKAYATNAYGTSYGEDVSFTTLQ